MSGNTVTRYVVSHVGRDGLRVMTGPRQGRYTFATRAEAEASARELISNDGPDRIASIYGSQAVGTFRGEAWECWAGHFDPVSIFADPCTSVSDPT